MKNKFLDKGYVNIGTVFNQSEIETLKSAINEHDEMQTQYNDVKALLSEGHPSFRTIYTMHNFDNIFGEACLRSEIVNSISDFFDDEAYLYHNKVALKYAGMIGFDWHQDYYYWYKKGYLFPDMATCFIALDDATIENGCLKVIPYSHKCGRIDHVLNDGTYADSECIPDRVEALEERFGIDYLELKAGEVAIFHGNLLHASDDNNSDKSRLALLGCYNTKRNSPVNSLAESMSYK